MRRITINGIEYQYRIGKQNAVIRTPERKSVVVSLSELTGRTPDTIERGRHKRTSDGMVKPGHVRGYIKKHLLRGVPS